MLGALRFPVGQSRGRRYPEPDHPYRNPFQRDRDRIVHARAFGKFLNSEISYALILNFLAECLSLFFSCGASNYSKNCRITLEGFVDQFLFVAQVLVKICRKCLLIFEDRAGCECCA